MENASLEVDERRYGVLVAGRKDLGLDMEYLVLVTDIGVEAGK
jgi:hypothetical protein